MLTQARLEVVKLLKKSGITTTPDALVYPPKSEMGELSLALFSFAKEQGKNPAELASTLASSLKPSGMIAEICAVGPYLNFFLNRTKVTELVLSGKKVAPFVASAKNGDRVMVEYVSPNVNKPLHVGHLRNVFLGQSLVEILRTAGGRVTAACLMNDLGVALMKAAYALKQWHVGETPKSRGVRGDTFVGDLYVEFAQKAGKDDAIKAEIDAMVRAWEAGDKKMIALWKKIVGWVSAGQAATLKRLNVRFDAVFYEHELWKQGKKVALDAARRGVFTQDETGALVARFPGTTLPDKVVLRSDGTNIYVTTDLALGDVKFKKYKLDRALWVVGEEQNLYLEQLFAMYRQLGYRWVDRAEHVSYGFVNLPEGRMKSREGTVVDAEDLLDELHALALEEVKKRDPSTSSGHEKVTRDQSKRAEIIGQAALRFFLLSVGPKSTMVYNPKESLVFTGKTGPYLLYTYARLASILKKAQSKGSLAKHIDLSPVEWSLVVQMAKYQEIVHESAKKRDPSIMANYTYDLAKRFADFYETTPVLKTEDKAVRNMRIFLISKTKSVLAMCLQLLTITPLERM